MLFVVTGTYGVGYQINNQMFFAKMLSIKTTIGEHSVMFHRKSEFNYKALEDMECYALKKTNLREIFRKFPELGSKLKR